LSERLVCLDTNIWSAVSRQARGSALQEAARAAGITIAVAPAVVYELLRTPDAKHRNRDVELVTRKTWSRLMTEVYQECCDVRLFIEQHHPEWVRDDPAVDDFARLQRDWSRKSGGFWDRARRDPSAEASRLGLLERGLVDAAYAEAKVRRQVFDRGGMTFDRLDIASLRARYHDADGPDREVELWRAEAEDYFWRQLVVSHKRGELTAEGDWLWWFLDIDRIAANRRAWRSMWLEEIGAEDVPRNWIRTALSAIQATRKTTRGTPADNQIALYLLDVDVLMTGDTGFVDVLEAIRPQCPVPLGTAVRLKPRGDVVSKIVDAATRGTD
jgi:hypothetical protein